MRYIISDTHFGHRNMMNYENRPYDTVEKMDRDMVEGWNNSINQDDTVIHLGDVRHHPAKLYAEDYLSKLNGNILLVRGNHDGGVPQNPKGFNVVESATIKHGKYIFYLEHQPVDTNHWQIHGHTHRHTPFIDREKKNINVSVEVIDYRPLRMDRLIGYLNKKDTFHTIQQARDG